MRKTVWGVFLLAVGFTAGRLPLAALAAQPSPPAVLPSVFAVTFRTGPAWDANRPPPEQPHFAGHSRNLRALREEGRLLVGGRYGDAGLVLMTAASLDEARGLVTRDPAVGAGTFKADVQPWSTFMPGCVGTPAPLP
jgi:uncharacterized protein YciI